MIDATQAQDVIELVHRYMKPLEKDGFNLEILEESIRKDGDWWYVPIRAPQEMRTYRLYDELTEIEEEIREKEKLDVMFVPRG